MYCPRHVSGTPFIRYDCSKTIVNLKPNNAIVAGN